MSSNSGTLSEQYQHVSAKSTDEWMKKLKTGKKSFTWIKGGDFEELQLEFPQPDFSKYKNLSIVDIFETFLDYDIINYLVDETRRYALFLNCPDPHISHDEIRCFISILYLSGYNKLPSKKSFWDSMDDMKNEAVCNAMRRDRFLQICRFIHCADNTQIDAKDKAWKIRPLMNMIKNKCLENVVPQKHLAYDESMVKYFGKHGCKQFIRGKPIRFGYKMWCVNTNDGYLVNFELYQGKDPRENEKYNSVFGKAVSPLILMLEDLPESKKNLPYSLYMDNLFTGLNVFNYVKYLGYSAIGTIRQNRIPKNCPLTEKKKFSKKERGSFETAIEKNKGILLVRWMDNAVVTMASTDVGTENVSSVRRYSQKHKKHINVSRPKLIAQYNQYMGGTDQMDQNIATYRIGVRGKKWWWPIFTWLLEIPMNNSWSLYKKVNSKQITQLDFRRELVLTYLQRYGVARIGAGRPSKSLSSSDSRVSDDIRYDRMDHLVSYTQEKKRRRCAKMAVNR